MSTTINQRIKEIADKLCDGNVSELARITGVNQPALRDAVGTRKASPRYETLSKIAASDALNINAEWLLTGKGFMLKNRNDIIQTNLIYESRPGKIPIYNIQAAGNLQTLFAKSKPYFIGEFDMPNPPHCDGAIYVRAENMRPLVKGGDMLAYKQLHNIKNLMSGEMYIVDYHLGGDNFLVIRYVKWEEKNETLRLASYDKHYDDTIIPVSAVQAMARVMMVLNIRSMS